MDSLNIPKGGSLLTVEQLAAWLQVKPTTIYQWVCEGYIPVIKVGSLNRFSALEVRAWLETRKVAGRTARRPAVVAV